MLLWKKHFFLKFSFFLLFSSYCLVVAETQICLHFQLFISLLVAPPQHILTYGDLAGKLYIRVCLCGESGRERRRLRKKARRLLIHCNLSWCHVLLSSSVCLIQWIFKFVIMIRIGYVFCRAQFEMKMWVGLPDLESQNRGLLVKCGSISALLRHNWQIKIVFKAYNPMFPCMYCEMVTTVKIANVIGLGHGRALCKPSPGDSNARDQLRS